MNSDRQTEPLQADKASAAQVDYLLAMGDTLERIDAVVAELEAVGRPTTTEAFIRRAELLIERDALRERVVQFVVQGYRGVRA